MNLAINELVFDNCLQSGRHSAPDCLQSGAQPRALVRPANPDGATGCLEFMMKHPIGGVVDWGETVSDWQTALKSPLMDRKYIFFEKIIVHNLMRYTSFFSNFIF